MKYVPREIKFIAFEACYDIEPFIDRIQELDPKFKGFEFSPDNYGFVEYAGLHFYLGCFIKERGHPMPE